MTDVASKIDEIHDRVMSGLKDFQEVPSTALMSFMRADKSGCWSRMRSALERP